MVYRCLHCKTELVAEVLDRSLVRCPACEFLFAASPGGRMEIPTFAEEGSLARLEAKIAVPAPAGSPSDKTQVGDTTDSFGSLPVPAGKSLFLEVVEAPEGVAAAGAVFPFTKGRVVIGRTGADIILDDERISRKHAVIEAISRENIYLKDLASTNGTFLNGHRIMMKKLAAGDELRLGNVTLRFQISDL